MGSTLNIQKQIKNQSKRVSLVCLPCAKICLFADALKELDDAYERYCRETDSAQRRKLQLSIQRALIRSQELGDEKIDPDCWSNGNCFSTENILCFILCRKCK